MFVSRDTLKNITEEIAANATSGPFAIGNNSALENSEKIEVLVRDRNDLRRVLSITPLVRLSDYAFEPFSGRILLARPQSSQDSNGNPVSMRISYEADQGGEAFWLTGVDGQLNLGRQVTIGGSLVKDQNPNAPFELASVNAGVKLSDNTTLVAEVAQTRAASGAGIGVPALAPLTPLAQTTGRAQRIELDHRGETLSAKVYVNRTDADFANPASGATVGTRQVGGSLGVKVTPELSLNADVRHQEDRASAAKRDGVTLGANWQLNPLVSLNAGLRRSEERGTIAAATQALGCNPAPGSAFGSGSGGGPGAATSTSLLNLNGTAACSNKTATGVATDQSATTVFVGATAKVTDKLTVNAQVEGGRSSQTADMATRIEVGASYQLFERTRLFMRADEQRGLASQYALTNASKSTSLALGIDSTYMEDGNLFSEYRLRDSVTARDAQIATGVRNAWHVSEGVTLTTGLERQKSLSGAGQNATAATLGMDYTASERWKASGRLEWRRLDATSGLVTTQAGLVPRQDTWLSTLSVGRKLDQNWTMLARNYYLATNNFGARPNGWQDRFQLGTAYRPVDDNRLDVLTKYEYKTENNINATDEFRRVHVGALQLNYHPERSWWSSGRVAAKQVKERFPSTEGGGQSNYGAYLLGGRVIFDISKNWDVGAMASVMRGRGDQQNGSSTQKALGIELGYLVATNLWLSAGYNWAGFTDRDLTSDYTARGAFVRLRFKFDKDLFNGSDPAINPSQPRN